MTIYRVGISAGHNPEAQGAKDRDPDDRNTMVTEFDYTVPWQAELIKQIKEFEPESDYLHIVPLFVETGKLGYKVEQVNITKCDLAIEIHFNAGAKTDGCETLFAPNSAGGEEAARVIHTQYAAAMGNRNRGIKEGWYKMDRPGVVDYAGDVDGDEKPDYFLAKTHMPALILEPEFMYSIGNARDKMVDACAAIVIGINELAVRKLSAENAPPEKSDG